MNDIIGNILQ